MKGPIFGGQGGGEARVDLRGIMYTKCARVGLYRFQSTFYINNQHYLKSSIYHDSNMHMVCIYMICLK